MTLLDALLEVNRAGNGAQQLTDMSVGTVETLNPLTIRMDVSQAALQESVLYLTENVLEKKITGFEHTHGVNITSESALSSPYNHTHSVSGATGSAPSAGSVSCTVNGETLPSDASGVTINKGLSVGDKVLLLAVQSGQKFIVLSRLY